MWPLYAAAFIAAELAAAVGLGRFLRRRDTPPPADVARLIHRKCVEAAADRRDVEFGDEDMESWLIELLHTDDADIAADYDGLLYAAAWLRLTSMPEPTDLGDDR